jgi:adenylate cyclase
VAETRQLAAIMFTDLVGYTSMMQKDEAMAVAIVEQHQKVLEESVPRHKGRVLQYYGDGSLNVFNSAVQAVECALDLQKTFLQEPLVPLRIGIHIGEILFSGDKVYGDGVNIASRIQSLGVGGSVLLSNDVQDKIRNHPNMQTMSMGFFKVKNVEKPIEVYALSDEGIVVPKRDQLGAGKWTNKTKRNTGIAILLMILVIGILISREYFTIPSIEDKSVAVMAFQDMSPNGDQEYLADGVAEEILNALAQIEGLKVAGRMSSFSFKGKNADHREVGSKLNVSTILEGSVRKDGNRIKITAQLIKADDGFHLWSDQFSRDDADIFAVQEDIARKVADRLELTLLSDASKPLVKIQTTNPEAYELYLKGRHIFNQRVEAEKAIEAFQQAVQLEPRFAEAYAALAYSWIMLDFTRQRPPNEIYPIVKMHALRSLELNPDLAEAHYALGIYQGVFEWDFEAEEKSYRKAIELNPQYPYAYLGLAITYIRRDDREQAIETAKRSLAIDPLNLYCMFFLGDYLRASGYTEEAMGIFNQILEIDPDYSEAYRGLGNAYITLKEFDRGIELLKESRNLTESKILVEMDLIRAYYRADRPEEIRLILQQWEQMLGETWIPAYYFGRAYYWLKEYENACLWMEKGFHDREIAVVNFMQRFGNESQALADNPACQFFLTEYKTRFPAE